MSNIVDNPVLFQYTQDAGEANPKHPLYRPNTIYFVEDPANKIGTIYLNGIPYREKGSEPKERNPIYIDISLVSYNSIDRDGGVVEMTGAPTLIIQNKPYADATFSYSILENVDYATINPNTGTITWNAYLGQINRTITVFIKCTIQGVIYTNTITATQEKAIIFDGYPQYFYNNKPHSDFHPDEFERVNVVTYIFRLGDKPQRPGQDSNFPDNYTTYQKLLDKIKTGQLYIVPSKYWDHYETTSEEGSNLLPYYATIDELPGYYIEIWKWSK